MDRESFRQMLQDEGYKPVAREIEPGYALDDHDHAWDTKGLVLRGSFTIACDGRSRTYGAGEVFELAARTAHTEHAGAEGADLLVGRRMVPE